MSQVFAGEFTYGHERISLIHGWDNGPNLYIGKFCSIGEQIRAYVGGGHRTDWATTYPFGYAFTQTFPGFGVTGQINISKGDITICNDVWIANNVTLMSGITIGSGAIIATNSTVVKDVAPYTIVGGNPAKPIKQRFEQAIIDRLLALKWWDLPPETINEIAVKLCSVPTIELLDELLLEHRC